MESKEFLEQKKIIELKHELERTKHKYKLEELMFERENNLILHNQILERGRINRAEERKLMIERRQYRT